VGSGRRVDAPPLRDLALVGEEPALVVDDEHGGVAVAEGLADLQDQLRGLVLGRDLRGRHRRHVQVDVGPSSSAARSRSSTPATAKSGET
jgi:hypothetical protein